MTSLQLGVANADGIGVDEQVSCPSCGAHAPVGAPWCGLCHHRFDAVPAVAVTTTPPVRPGAGGPDPSAIVRPVHDYSRRRGGATSFGLAGRIGWTVGVFAPPVVILWFSGGLVLIPAAMWVVIAVPLVLKDVWKRERIG